MYMTDTFCSFMRNVIFKTCFLLSQYGSIIVNSVSSRLPPPPPNPQRESFYQSLDDMWGNLRGTNKLSINWNVIIQYRYNAGTEGF